MKHYTLLLILVTTILFTACIQPATAPVATTASGLQIIDPWARQAQMRNENAMSGAAMTNTVGMSNTTAMTASAAMSSTTPMTGTMGMGMGGAMGAMYMTIRNTTGTPDRLIKAQSDVAKVVELHNVAMKDGVMSMYPVETIEIPANGEAVLKPGSFHVMLIGLNRDLVVGESMTVTLTFEQAGDVTLQAPIRER
ncbi:MAG: copper chaperone PCu(A)C [Caldilinea sp. CFX5]|nr:copper chaperone PCu(A)C [Caldilinea sp. CFX5]